MERLNDLAAFVAVIDKGSQTAAARFLGRSLQSINRSLMALERCVGVELVLRTTRQSTATEAGLAFYRRVKPALADIADARQEAVDNRHDFSGLIRIGAPVQLASAHVAPAICDFMERHPRIEVELKPSDREVDVFDDELDVAVRIRHLADSGLKVRRLGEIRVVVFGSPAYFSRNGRPRHPDDLMQHECIAHAGHAQPWPFRVDGKRKLVRAHGRLSTNSIAAATAAALRGFGLGMAPLWQIRDLVEDGLLEVVLEEFEAAKFPIHAVFPPTRMPIAKTRALIDVLAKRLDKARLGQ